MALQNALARIAEEAARGDIVFPTDAQIALQVQRALDDPDCSVERLSRLIAAEPVLSARIVAIANSVAYRRSGRPTTDVRSALSRIGFRSTRTLASAVVVRQMATMPKVPEHRALAAALWTHSVHVAALARVIAQRVVRKDPETAFFAGIVHEAGGFYLLARAASFPGLIDGHRLEDWDDDGEAQEGSAVLRDLGVPDEVVEAANVMWDGYVAFPPASLGDVLLLAERLAPVESPLARLTGSAHGEAPLNLDVEIESDTLMSILAQSADEVQSLVEALNA
jgi:HD-like signal output (HDOD) protein